MPSPLRSPRDRRKVRDQKGFRKVCLRLLFEQLEDITLLSPGTTLPGTITGTVWSDPAGTDVRTPGAPGIPGQTVYLDLNHDHVDDSTATTVAGDTVIGPAVGALGGFGFDMASADVEGLPAKVSNLKVTMDLANDSSSPVLVGIVSPTGLTVPDFPILFTIQPGEHFVGSFDDNATQQVTLASRPLAPGTYVPQQLFDLSSAHIYDGSPDGTWGLVFAGDGPGFVLKSWSLSFTLPDPSARTDAGGNYSFTGLDPGTYQVETVVPPGASLTSPSGDGANTVTVAAGQTVSGVDFGVVPASDLIAQSISLAAPATAWGQDVTVDYTLTNRGPADAPAFDVGVYLSADGTIRSSGPLVQTIHIAGLASGASVSGSVTVPLPAAPPAGFGAVADSYLGLDIDPTHALTRNDAADGSNQGLGIDVTPLAVAPNDAVASGTGVQQMPSIAVDPADPGHLVVAYMDSTLVSTGYEGIGVSVSHDGGANWQRTSIPLPAGFAQGAATPVAHFGSGGRVYVSFAAATFLGPDKPALTNPSSTQRKDGFQADNGIFVAGSGDGGLTWGTPVSVESFTYNTTTQAPVPFDFSPTFGVDAFKTLPNGAANPDYGDLYVAWVRAYPAGQFPGHSDATAGDDIMFSVSKDGGATWTTQTQTDSLTGATVSAIRDPMWAENGDLDAGRGFMNYPQVSVGPQGDVYVSAYGGNDFDVFHSTDNGASFTAPDRNDQLNIPFYGLLNLPIGSLFADSFRTNPVRDIVADPSHPGRVFVSEFNPVNNNNVGGDIDPGEILFAASNDYGQTWRTIFQVGGETTNFSDLTPTENDSFLSVLNDDDSGRDTANLSFAQLNTEVLDGEVLPSMSVDAQGNLTVIWYDTRRDPLQANLDVYGTVSTDGGQTFSPNFRVTDATSNPADGAFTDAKGNPNEYLGDRISVASDDGVSYAVWTDTRNGSQDIYFQQFRVTPPPPPPLDRLSPNGTPATATPLGQILAQFVVPSLIVTPGQDSWFNFQAGSTGELVVTAATSGGGGAGLQLQLTDADGHPLPAVVTPVLDASGAVIGEQAVYPGVAGQTYLAHVSGGAEIGFNLTLGSLTADLGTRVEGTQVGTITPGGTDAYRLVAGVAGTLQLTLTPGDDVVGGDLFLQVLSADGQTVLASGTPSAVASTLSLPVAQGQTVLLEVQGADGGEQGSFSLSYTNLDQYESATGVSSIFIPTASAPSSVAIANLSGNGLPDIVASSVGTSDPVVVLDGNADGTFQAPRQFDVGPGLNGAISAGNRQVGVADFNGDGVPDVIVPNFRAGDVSVLLGNGDGSLQPERRFDAVPGPDALVTGHFTESGNVDVAVLQNFSQTGGVAQLAILAGRGDGTFKPATQYPTIFQGVAVSMVVGDFTGNGISDIIVFSREAPVGEVFLGNGDGTFRAGPVISTGEDTLAAEAVQLDGPGGPLSLIATGVNSGDIHVLIGNGDGTFQPPLSINAMAVRPGDNVSVNGLAVVGLPSTVGGSPGATGLATVTGTPGVYVTAAARSGAGAPEVIFLPALFDGHGHFTGFDAPQVVAQVGAAGKVVAYNQGGRTNLVVADAGGIRVLYGLPGSSGGLALTPNDTPATARDLGSAAHMVTPPQAVVAGHEDAYFTFKAPTEAVSGGGDEVIDFSALFQDITGAGLQLEVLDPEGHQLGSGDRFRVVVPQGEVLTVHVSGLAGDGGVRATGIYTLDIDVLPQLVSVQAESVVSGGPATSIVLTFQGDRLDAAAAQDPGNYTVIWQGPDGSGGASARVIPISTSGALPVVYNPGASVDVTSGLAYPTAVRQTVTLLFDEPLPAGDYVIEISPNVGATPYSDGESALLAGGATHSLVSVSDGVVAGGVNLRVSDLVTAGGTPGSLDEIAKGTPFLTQLQNDLTAIINAMIAANGDDPTITPEINSEIQARFAPTVAAAGASAPSFAIIWFDPVSIDLQSPQGQEASYSLATNAEASTLGQSYVSVGGNVEMIVLANATGDFNLDVSNVPGSARGGEVTLNSGANSEVSLTDALREGTGAFSLNLGELAGSTPGTPGEPSGAVPGEGATVVSNNGSTGESSGGGEGSSSSSSVASNDGGGSSTGSGTGGALTLGLSAQATVALLTGLTSTSAVASGSSSGGSSGGGPGQSLVSSDAEINSYSDDLLEQEARAKSILKDLLDGVDEVLDKWFGPSDGDETLLPYLLSPLQVFNASKALRDALGRDGRLPGVIEQLNRSRKPAADGDAGPARRPSVGENAPVRPFAPANLDVAPPAPAEIGDEAVLLWDRGVDGLLREDPVAEEAGGSPENPAYWAALFLSFAAYRVKTRRRPRVESPSREEGQASPAAED